MFQGVIDLQYFYIIFSCAVFIACNFGIVIRIIFPDFGKVVDRQINDDYLWIVRGTLFRDINVVVVLVTYLDMQ